MNVKCFGCEGLIEAGDVDAVCDAFVAHGKAQHAWDTPEQALRNYARNCAEAPLRLTGVEMRKAFPRSVAVSPIHWFTKKYRPLWAARPFHRRSAMSHTTMQRATMVPVGLDPGDKISYVYAVDAGGARVAEATISTTPGGVQRR